MIARRLVVRGRVQGVGYRDAMVDEALASGIAGWVRNRRDGTVEALVQGAPGGVETLVTWARRGPPGARVEGVVVEEVDVDAASRAFERRPTV